MKNFQLILSADCCRLNSTLTSAFIPREAKSSWPVCNAILNVFSCCWNWGLCANSRRAVWFLCSSGKWGESRSSMSGSARNEDKTSGLRISPKLGPITVLLDCKGTPHADASRDAANVAWFWGLEVPCPADIALQKEGQCQQYFSSLPKVSASVNKIFFKDLRTSNYNVWPTSLNIQHHQNHCLFIYDLINFL